MRICILLLALLPLGLAAQTASPLISRIAFGSCAQQDKAQPILDTVLRHNLDVFIYLGDNIYGDSKDLNELRRKYNQIEVQAQPEYQRMKNAMPIYATWDDHDYGWNGPVAIFPSKKRRRNCSQSSSMSQPTRPAASTKAFTLLICSRGKAESCNLSCSTTAVFQDDLRIYRGN